MAISPKGLEKNFNEEVLSFESVIDSALKNEKLYKGGSVNIGVPRGMTSTHFRALEAKYLAAGWSKVSWTDDQRDGSYLVFKY